MSSPKKPDKELPAHPKPGQDEHSEGACRPTFYMSTDLLAAIEEQCAAEDKKRSPFVAEVLEFLLTSPVGEQLRETERIIELAEASQRHPDQMLVRLILLGLRVYERAIARMEADIEGSNELS
jgi:hypothetical protein